MHRDLATERKHSTYFDALRVGRAMGAKFVIPTHFGTRFPLFPLRGEYRAPHTSPAVDLMSIRMSDLHQQQLDSPLCRDIFHRLLTMFIDTR